MASVGPLQRLALQDELLGQYKLLGHLGRGGMADVFLAVDQSSGAMLAMKVLRASFVDDPEWVASFLDEARVSLQLDHPNIVKTLDVVKLGNATAIVLEFLDGGSFAELRRESSHDGAKIPLEIGLFALTEALAGLHHAHEQKGSDGVPLDLVHRDFTPNNIFVTLDGRVKVLDFGLAKTTETSVRTSTGIVKGTVRYLAPEAILGIFINRRADVYAAGVALWEIASGARAWNGLNDVAILNRVSTGPSPSLREVMPEADDELVGLCDRSFTSNRKDRFESAEAMRAAILAYMDRRDLVCDRSRLAAYVEAQLGRACRERKARFEAAALAPGSEEDTAVHGGTIRHENSAPRFGAESSRDLSFPTSVSTKPILTGPPPPGQRLRRAPFTALSMAASLLILAAAGFTYTSRWWRQPQGLPAMSAAAPSSVAEVKPSMLVQHLVRVTVRAAPPSSLVMVDGESIATRDGVLILERPEGSVHLVLVQAPNHLPIERVIRFVDPHEEAFVLNEAQSTAGVEPQLRNKATPAASGTATIRPTGSATGKTESAARRGAPRRIDEKNPFDE